jgi:hypothetical protein
MTKQEANTIKKEIRAIQKQHRAEDKRLMREINIQYRAMTKARKTMERLEALVPKYIANAVRRISILEGRLNS